MWESAPCLQQKLTPFQGTENQCLWLCAVSTTASVDLESQAIFMDKDGTYFRHLELAQRWCHPDPWDLSMSGAALRNWIQPSCVTEGKPTKCVFDGLKFLQCWSSVCNLSNTDFMGGDFGAKLIWKEQSSMVPIFRASISNGLIPEMLISEIPFAFQLQPDITLVTRKFPVKGVDIYLQFLLNLSQMEMNKYVCKLWLSTSKSCMIHYKTLTMFARSLE